MGRATRAAVRMCQLTAGTAGPVDGDAFHLAAYFDRMLTPDEPVVQRVAVFARKHGARAELKLTGAPFVGVVCHVVVDPLTKAALEEFLEVLKPTMHSAIRYL